ncbi:hypothetical protein N0V85_000634 [Neurospora sp. IMI 360204]|nr:hypothetical protein N0V85_000634 [Neurospora sp. IMI 360204]
MGGGLTDRLAHPDDTHLAILSRLLLRLTVAKLKSVLDLPGKVECTVQVVFDADPAAQNDISLAVKQGQRYLRLSRHSNSRQMRARLVAKAFIYLTRARQIDSNRLLTEPLSDDDKDPAQSHHEATDAVNRSVQNEDTRSIDVTDRHLRRRTVISYEEDFEENNEAGDEDYEDDGFDFDRDLDSEWDEDVDTDEDENDDLDSNVNDDEQIENGCASTTKTRGRNDPAYTAKWLWKLRDADNRAIFSPKVRAIMETIVKIFKIDARNRQPPPMNEFFQDDDEDTPPQNIEGRKIMISATSVKFLDILHEAIRRLAKLRGTYQDEVDDESLRLVGGWKFINDSLYTKGMDYLTEAKVAEYNGTMSIQQRDAVLRKFNQPSCKGHSILLISSTSGGIGINVTGASDLIICEPHWAPGLRDQIIGRIWRMSQKRSVGIWDILARSAIDDLILTRTKSKTELKGKLLKHVVRKDGQAIIMPRV